MDPKIISEIFTAAYGTQILTRGAKIIQRPGWYQVISPGSKTPSRNEIVHSSVLEENIDQVIEDTIREYESIGTPFKWCLTPLTKPIQMPEILRARGFRSWSCRDMYLELQNTPPSPIEGLQIVDLAKPNLEEFVDCYLKGWNPGKSISKQEELDCLEDFEWVLEKQKGFAFNSLVRFKGKAVGTGGFFLKEHSGYLMGGNILKDFRGQGFYKALVQQRLWQISQAGKSWALSAARESTSAPILEKLGFKTAFRSSVFQWKGELPE